MSATVSRAGLIWVSVGVAAAAAVLLASCARDPSVTGGATIPVGNWSVARANDPITGAPTIRATLTTLRVSYPDILFPPPVQMSLFCFKERPSVLFRFPFKVGSNRNGEFSYRFDDKPGHVAEARFVDDYRSVVIEDGDEVRRFAGEMATSNVLYVRTRALNAKPSSADFHIEGAPGAVSAAFAGCPLAPPAKLTSAAQPQRL
ncbi:MAG TPA: hypothetical protein VMI47_10220 [Pseudolabrys sp.]|nr:hypothetical protein [Pseudolabrys sp.]